MEREQVKPLLKPHVIDDDEEKGEWKKRERENGEDECCLQRIRCGRGRVKNGVWCTVLCIWVIIIGGIIAAGVSLSLFLGNKPPHSSPPRPSIMTTCEADHIVDQCKFSIVESIPENLTYPDCSPSHLSTYESWVWLLEEANDTIDIASYYWTLRGTESISDPTDYQGTDIYNRLIEAHSRGVKIRVVQTPPSSTQPNHDSLELAEQGVIELRNLNIENIIGSGILHTKLWIVDGRYFYIGSANMDWRALTQVKELGLFGQDCYCLTQDVQKIFEVYWELADTEVIPPEWSESLTAETNITHPALMTVNGSLSQVYWTSSPPPFSTKYRTDDITGVLDIINKADQFIYIAVMDYLPAIIYSSPKKYWPIIDDALRSAAYDRGVHVRLMASHWPSSKPDMTIFLKSLGTWNNTGPYGGSIKTKFFIVPELTNRTIPYTRVNHNKYMVTDNAALISTSNWSGDYFISTGGISCVVNDTSSDNNLAVQEQLRLIFERDWNSNYTVDVLTFNDN